MSKQEKREQIISENDNQFIISEIIETVNFSQTNELRISKILRGDVDFSILKDKDIKNVNAIYIENPGEITNLFNIPDTVKIIQCREHMLEEVQNLPKDIEEIDFSHNNIKQFDTNELINLTSLNISNNELNKLSKLPDSLLFLNVENNQLKELNLETTQKLKHLICSNNPILVLQNVPTSLTKIEMENNPFIEIERGDGDGKTTSKKKLNYLQSLNEYFRLKNEYENSYMTLKRKAYDKGHNKKHKQRLVNDVNPLCSYCKRKVGSLFSHKDNYYSAKCGDQRSPCNLDISIYEGDYTNIEEIINLFSQDMEEDKEQIIIDKMNSIFKYIDSDSYSAQFKEHISIYTETSDVYKETIDRYDAIHNNEEKHLLIDKKTNEIIHIKDDMNKILEEYKKTGNKNLLLTLTHTYKRDLIPAVEHLRNLKYAHMFVEIIESDPPVSVLVQHSVSAHSRDYLFGEEPSVLKFVTNA